MLSKRLRGAGLTGLVTLLVIAGCNGTDSIPGAGDVCCTDFKVGADLSQVDFGVEADIKGQYVAFAQASADLAATAQAMVDDVAGACKAIAQAGGANADGDDKQPAAPAERVKFWCDLASARLDAVFQAQGGAKAALDIQVTPAECKASFKAEAKCQASCDVSGQCDVNAKPPTCEGGKLEVSCEGSCDVSAEAPTIACEGKCEGTCEGSCSAEGGVAVTCEGTCDGTCEATGEAGTGIQADGSCKGKCNGTCTASATAPKIQCEGTCKGQCNAKCTASPGQAKVKCDGQCSGTAEPISCKGGELRAQCEVDANCSANCKGSAEAKAECTPPRVDIAFKASAQASATAEASLVADALRVNLPSILLVFEARGKAFADLVANVSASGAGTLKGGASGKLGVKGTACLIPIAGAIAAAVDNSKASVEAAGSISAKVK